MNDNDAQTDVVKELPPEITNLLENSDLDNYLFFTLLKDYEIPDDAKILVVFTTRALLSGDIEPTEFVKIITTITGLPQEKATFIAQDINRDIFNPVKDALKQLHNIGSEAHPASPIPTPYQDTLGEIAPIQQPPSPTAGVSETMRPAASPLAIISTPVLPAEKPTPTPQSILAKPKPLPTLGISTPPTPPPAPITAAPLPQPPRPVTSPSTPAPLPPQVVAIPKTAPSVPNNLEAKLGGAFTIKKEVMYTQLGTPQPLTPMPTGTANILPRPQQKEMTMPTPPPAATAPLIPPPPGDPYREMPQ